MTERDRLAADIASIRFGAKVEHPSQYEYDWADRLIALGWTNPRTPEGQDRLARALERVIDDGWYYRDLYKSRPNEDAAAIAKEYRGGRRCRSMSSSATSDPEHVGSATSSPVSGATWRGSSTPSPASTTR